MALIQCAAESGTASFPIILHPVLRLHPNSTERCRRQGQGRQRPSEGAHRLPERASLRCSPLFFSSRSLSAEDLIIHSGTDTEQTTVMTRTGHRLSCQMAQHRARSIHTRANSLLVVELRGDCGWTAWSAHRQDEEPCTLLRSCTTHALAPHVLRAGSGPRAPLLLRESARIKGDKAGIRKQRPHTTVASPPSVRPRHVRRMC